MYIQKVISKNSKKNFVAIIDEKSRIRIRIHDSEVRIRGSGSIPKCHGSGTLPVLYCCSILYGFVPSFFVPTIVACFRFDKTFPLTVSPLATQRNTQSFFPFKDYIQILNHTLAYKTST
jgi:hypothetical protein